MTNSLDKIKATFSQAKDRAPDDVARDESLWTPMREAFNHTTEVINM